MTDLVAFIEARLDEDEAVARAAIDAKRPGTHWQWVESDTDELYDEHRGAEFLPGNPSLRTVEEFQTDFVFTLPAFPIPHAEEVHPGAASHIARHDPARVLAGVAAKRRVLERLGDDDAVYDEIANVEQPLDAEDMTRGALWARNLLLRALASEWADHPDYDEAWERR